jgi:hypothetical protein
MSLQRSIEHCVKANDKKAEHYIHPLKNNSGVNAEGRFIALAPQFSCASCPSMHNVVSLLQHCGIAPEL